MWNVISIVGKLHRLHSSMGHYYIFSHYTNASLKLALWYCYIMHTNMIHPYLWKDMFQDLTIGRIIIG